MITVKMIKDAKGSVDGVIIRDFKKGFEYEIPESLAESFVIMGVIKHPKKQEVETPEKPKGLTNGLGNV